MREKARDGYLTNPDISETYTGSTRTKSAYVSVPEIMKLTGCSKSSAYRLISKLNEKMKISYPDALYIKGKVNRDYFEQMCYPVRHRQKKQQE